MITAKIQTEDVEVTLVDGSRISGRVKPADETPVEVSASSMTTNHIAVLPWPSIALLTYPTVESKGILGE